MIHGFGLDVLFGIPEKQSKRHDTAGNCATDFASAEAGNGVMALKMPPSPNTKTSRNAANEVWDNYR